MNDLNLIKPLGVQNIINKFCMTIGMIPTSYKLSLTYEEQILAIGKYLEETVYPAINNNAEALAELQSLFAQLKNYVDNYFDDLDIQEEVNNKLNEMAESGELTEIISSYLNTKALLCFDNINEMKNSNNLIVGSFVKTLGYHIKNDGGSAIYKIREILNTDIVDDGLIIPLNTSDNLIAELQSNKHNVVCWGAYNNDQQSSSNAIEKAIAFNTGSYIEFPSGTFNISEPIKTYSSISNFTNIFMKSDTIIKAISEVTCIFDIGGIEETFEDEVGDKKYLKGGIINAEENVTNCAIKIEQKIKDLQLENIQLYTNCNGIICGNDTTSSQDLYINHVLIKHKNIANTHNGIIINSNDNSISDTRIYFNKKAVVCNGSSSYFNNIHTLANNLQNDSISFEVNSNNIFMDNCYGDSEDTFMKINGTDIHPYVIMSNCEYYSYRNNTTTIFDIETYARLKINNLFINCKSGNEHIGIKCPYDYLPEQLSQEMLNCNGLSIEGQEYMRDGDILKGLTVDFKGKPSFLSVTFSSPISKNEWYVLGYFPATNRIFNNLNLFISNRKSNYPIYVTCDKLGNLLADIGVGLAETVDTADYAIGYKCINPNFDSSTDYPRLGCYFMQTSSQNRWINDIQMIGNKVIPFAQNKNRGTVALEKTTDVPSLKYSITGSTKAISLLS